MGEPIRITRLAEEIIRLSGMKPGKDIEIVYTGVRPGEKLFEEMLTTEEVATTTKHRKIFVAKDAELNVETSSVAMSEIAAALDAAEGPEQAREILVDFLRSCVLGNWRPEDGSRNGSLATQYASLRLTVTEPSGRCRP
ncbi:MAG: polysaccharide biosynthesis protein [Clostridia bacterium]|nr:polysaccharide biosynthesis protein [Clostridia bacterium]